MLIDLLDRLGVKHRQGETDESFLVAGATDKIRDAASWLMARHDRVETIAYLRYIAYQQRSPVFDDWDGILVTGGDDATTPTPEAPAEQAPATDESDAATPADAAPADGEPAAS